MAPLELQGRFYKLSPAGRFDGLQPIALRVDLDRAALLVVDVYGLGFTPEEGEVPHHPSTDDMAHMRWERVARDAIHPALTAARSAGLPVVYVHNSGPRIELNRSQIGRVLNRTLGCNLEEMFRERNVDPREYLVGTENLYLETSQLVGSRDGDYYIRKHQYSGFKDTRLDSLLRNLGVTTLFCVGFNADACLKMTMVDAFELNYELVLLRDATCALEIPEDSARGYSFTERIIWWMEAHICTSITADDFVQGLASFTRGTRSAGASG